MNKPNRKTEVWTKDSSPVFQLLISAQVLSKQNAPEQETDNTTNHVNCYKNLKNPS